MRISSKGRYALASMVYLAQIETAGTSVAIITLSQQLDISKIYLEQVFSLLRRSGIVKSEKGAQGGYQLARPASEITSYDILAATETGLFDEPEQTVAESAPALENTLTTILFRPANESLIAFFKNVTLADLLEHTLDEMLENSHMYYI